ncbi:MAG: AMP-binding protein [Deltaproteobacteria bacterium]|nr:AMP-binding protein [Deltaproteobacteria bacterium]
MIADLLKTLQTQIEKVSRMDFYKRKLDQAGVTANSIQSIDDFNRIPFTSGHEILEELNKKPSECSLFTPAVTRVNLSPSGQDLFPVYNTNQDLQKMHEVAARAYEAAGVTPDDICAVTFGYHLFIAGLYYQSQLEYYGAKVIPLGPGESERAVEVINKYQVTVLISNPTFAMKLAAKGIPSVRILFVGGEPFTSVEGYPEKVRAAFGRKIGMIDSYGMALCSPIARSCRFEKGMHLLDDFIYAEVIDPLTGAPVPLGEKGELVLTHLHKEASPLLRYRTGDLTYMIEEKCPCGRSFTLPKGIIGRTDEMLKIKGVKFWPSQIGAILQSVAGAGKKYRVVVRNPQGVDTISLMIEGTEGSVDLEELARRLKRETLLAFNEILLIDHFDQGPVVEDQRQGRTF